MVSRMVSFFLRLLVLTFIRLALHCHIVYRVFHSTIHLAKNGSFFCSSKLSQSFFSKIFHNLFFFFRFKSLRRIAYFIWFLFRIWFFVKNRLISKNSCAGVWESRCLCIRFENVCESINRCVEDIMNIRRSHPSVHQQLFVWTDVGGGSTQEATKLDGVNW